MIPEFPEFKKLEFSDKAEVEQFTKDFPPYSDFNFVSMWSWDTKGETGISQLNGNLVVRLNDYLSKEPFYSFIGQNKIKETIEYLTDFSAKNGQGSKLKLVPEEITNQHKSNDFLYISDHDNFDYIYAVKDFAACAGKKYETQRNQISRFEKKYPDAVVKVYTDFNEIKGQILLLEQRWKLNKIVQDKTLEFRSESEALRRFFEIRQENFLTVCIFVKDELVAFCVSELLDSEYAISHFAKADVSFSGIYSFLFHKTCMALINKNREYLNYEQDLGLIYLRHSKMSFRPIKFLKKTVIIRQ